MKNKLRLITLNSDISFFMDDNDIIVAAVNHQSSTIGMAPGKNKDIYSLPSNFLDYEIVQLTADSLFFGIQFN